MIIGAQFDPPTSGSLKATAFWSGQPYHALPISIAYLLNGLARGMYQNTFRKKNVK